MTVAAAPQRMPVAPRSLQEAGPVQALPKSPVLGWRDFLRGSGHRPPSVGDLPHRLLTTSGRAALFAALQQLKLAPGTGVLVPTYHCPTMVAPILRAGLKPVYFPIGDDGLPLLEALTPERTAQARVMFCAHYFGLPRDLGPVVGWARAAGVVLVEDCAHSFFGMAGSRPIGTWGDFATASLSKFFPVPEGGMLASARHALSSPSLRPAGLRAELKSAVDVIEWSTRHHRLAGLRHLASPLLWAKNRGAPQVPGPITFDPGPADAASMMDDCDMARVGQQPSMTVRGLFRLLPAAPIVASRRRNYDVWTRTLHDTPGARGLFPALPEASAPYVWPLWVDGADRAEAVYARVRQQRLPVFRWDRIWPGTPCEPHDAGSRWSRQVLQLLCHQDLSVADIERVASQLRDLLHRH